MGDVVKYEMLRQGYKRLLDENAVMRFALQECSAPYYSPPCTVGDGAVYLAKEFQRRMNIAGEALHDLEFPENEWTDS